MLTHTGQFFLLAQCANSWKKGTTFKHPQSDFREFHSTADNINLESEIREAFANRQKVLIVFFFYNKKAYDMLGGKNLTPNSLIGTHTKNLLLCF